MVLGTRAGAHAMAIFWSWHAKEEVCLRYSVNHERLNHETKRKSRSDDSHEPVKVQAGSRGFPRARTDSKVAHDQARYAKVTAWRGAAQATSSWSLTMSDETSAQLDVENWTNTVQFCPTPDKCSTILGFWYYNYRADVSDRPPIWEVISK